MFWERRAWRQEESKSVTLLRINAHYVPHNHCPSPPSDAQYIRHIEYEHVLSLVTFQISTGVLQPDCQLTVNDALNQVWQQIWGIITFYCEFLDIILFIRFKIKINNGLINLQNFNILNTANNTIGLAMSWLNLTLRAPIELWAGHSFKWFYRVLLSPDRKAILCLYAAWAAPWMHFATRTLEPSNKIILTVSVVSYPQTGSSRYPHMHNAVINSCLFVFIWQQNLLKVNRPIRIKQYLNVIRYQSKKKHYVFLYIKAHLMTLKGNYGHFQVILMVLDSQKISKHEYLAP